MSGILLANTSLGVKPYNNGLNKDDFYYIEQLELSLGIKLKQIEINDMFKSERLTFSTDDNNNVIGLSLENLHLKFIPIKISNLKKLQIINLSYNEIEIISNLDNLKELRRLWIMQNKLKDISGLKEINQIEYLQLFYNQIEDIGVLKNFINLEHIDLQNNQIKNISPIAFLTQLNSLLLAKNQIFDISPIKNLKKLKWLSLGENYISHLPSWITDFDLNIEWKDTVMGNIGALNLYKNPIQKPPIEIIKQGKQAIKEWFNSPLFGETLIADWYKANYSIPEINFGGKEEQKNAIDLLLKSENKLIGIQVKSYDFNKLHELESKLYSKDYQNLLPSDLSSFDEFHLVIITKAEYAKDIVDETSENIANNLFSINPKLKLMTGFINDRDVFINTRFFEMNSSIPVNFKIRKMEEGVVDDVGKAQIVQQIYIEGSFTIFEFKRFFQQYANKLKSRKSKYHKNQTNILLYFYDIETRATSSWFAMYHYSIDSTDKFSFNESLLNVFSVGNNYYSITKKTSKKLPTKYSSVMEYFENFHDFNLSNGTLKIISENHFQISSRDAQGQNEKIIIEDVKRILIRTICRIFIHTEINNITLTAIPMEISKDNDLTTKYLDKYSTTISIDRNSTFRILQTHLNIKSFDELVEADNKDEKSRIFSTILYEPTLNKIWKEFENFIQINQK